MTGAMVWNVVGWMLAAAGVVAVVLGLLWDRSKGRKRCPSCWYDMQGVDDGGGAKCPECGHGVKSERSLLRTRRWWRLVVVGVVLLLAAYPAGQYPLLRAGKWREAVPTWVIVYCWPLNFDAWENTGVDPMMDELFHARLQSPTHRAWAARRVVSRLKDYYATSHRGSPVSRLVVCSVDLSGSWDSLGRSSEASLEGIDGHVTTMTCFGPNSGSTTERITPDMLLADESRDIMQELVNIVFMTVEPDGWIANGGDSGRVYTLGPFLVFIAPPEMAQRAQAEVQALVDCAQGLDSPAGRSPCKLSSHGELCVTAYPIAGLLELHPVSGDDRQRYLMYERAGLLTDLIIQHVDPSGWRQEGGDSGFTCSVRAGLLIVCHRPEVQAEIESFLRTLEGSEWWKGQ